MPPPLRWALFSSPPLGALWAADNTAVMAKMLQPSYHPARAFMSKAKVSAMPGLREKTRIMSASEIERTLIRLAHQIIEKNNGGQNLGLVGIKRRGVPLAVRLGHLIAGIEKKPVDTGVLDINFYRDDLSTRDIRPVVVPGAIGFDIAGRDIILIDDVLYTGRTIRAALDALFAHSRPRR